MGGREVWASFFVCFFVFCVFNNSILPFKIHRSKVTGAPDQKMNASRVSTRVISVSVRQVFII